MKFFHSAAYSADIGGHVFPVGKFGLTAALLRGSGEFVGPPVPSREELLLAHDPVWVEKVLSCRMSLEDEALMELPFGREVSLAHQLQVSGTILACREALSGGIGLHVGGGSHHAFRDHGEGFCVLNDIACGILKMLEEGRIKRAAVVDLDVHQGNGTAEIFKAERRVFTFSMHEAEIYPRNKRESSLDIGLERGTGDEEYMRLLRANLPRVLDFRPELVVFQAGVDCAQGDLLGGLSLTKEGLLERDKTVYKEFRDNGIAVAVTLGGGYGRDLSVTAGLHAQTLLAALPFS